MSTKVEVQEKAQVKEASKESKPEAHPEPKKVARNEAKPESKKDTEAKAEPRSKTGEDLSPKLQQLIESIEKLTVMELARFVKALEERFGVSAQAAVAVPAPIGGAMPAASASAEEKTSFQVVLASAGEKKIQVIKEIRAVTNLGLKEAKDLVESAPKPIKDNATKEEAQKIKATLEAAGAKVEIK